VRHATAARYSVDPVAVVDDVPRAAVVDPVAVVDGVLRSAWSRSPALLSASAVMFKRLRPVVAEE